MEKHYITRTFDPYDRNKFIELGISLHREFGRFGIRWGAEYQETDSDARTVRYWFVNENDRLIFALKYLHD